MGDGRDGMRVGQEGGGGDEGSAGGLWLWGSGAGVTAGWEKAAVS